MKQKFIRIIRFVRGFFPSPTPVGVSEFHDWAQDIIDTYKPAASDASVKFALGEMLMRLNPTAAYKSKFYFALCLHKSAASQIGLHVLTVIKEEQLAKQKAAQLAEATANPVASSEQQT